MDAFERLKCNALVKRLQGLSLAKGSIIIPRSKLELHVGFSEEYPIFERKGGKNTNIPWASMCLLNESIFSF